MDKNKLQELRERWETDSNKTGVLDIFELTCVFAVILFSGYILFGW